MARKKSPIVNFTDKLDSLGLGTPANNESDLEQQIWVLEKIREAAKEKPTATHKDDIYKKITGEEDLPDENNVYRKKLYDIVQNMPYSMSNLEKKVNAIIDDRLAIFNAELAQLQNEADNELYNRTIEALNNIDRDLQSIRMIPINNQDLDELNTLAASLAKQNETLQFLVSDQSTLDGDSKRSAAEFLNQVNADQTSLDEIIAKVQDHEESLARGAARAAEAVSGLNLTPISGSESQPTLEQLQRDISANINRLLAAQNITDSTQRLQELKEIHESLTTQKQILTALRDSGGPSELKANGLWNIVNMVSVNLDQVIKGEQTFKQMLDNQNIRNDIDVAFSNGILVRKSAAAATFSGNARGAVTPLVPERENPNLGIANLVMGEENSLNFKDTLHGPGFNIMHGFPEAELHGDTETHQDRSQVLKFKGEVIKKEEFIRSVKVYGTDESGNPDRYGLLKQTHTGKVTNFSSKNLTDKEQVEVALKQAQMIMANYDPAKGNVILRGHNPAMAKKVYAALLLIAKEGNIPGFDKSKIEVRVPGVLPTYGSVGFLSKRKGITQEQMDNKVEDDYIKEHLTQHLNETDVKKEVSVTGGAQAKFKERLDEARKEGLSTEAKAAAVEKTKEGFNPLDPNPH